MFSFCGAAMLRAFAVLIATAPITGTLVGSQQQCSCAAATPCKYDPTCASGGLGCDAQGQKLCRFCGFGAYVSIPCDPPTPSPPTPPTPAPAPPTPATNASSCFRGGAEVGGVPLTQQKALAAAHWPYKWGPAPYGHPSDVAGVLQVVNGGSQPLWVRYGGDGISPGDGPYDWQPFITNASALNGGRAHAWNALGAHGMRGQGDGFRLGPGEYQIVPFSSSSCWLGGSLGCCAHGNDCHVSPSGRGAGTDASPSGQPNTLFEWTAPGVWDASLVDGFGLPMKVEVDGCGKPGSGTAADCGGSDPVTYLSFEPAKCPNPILTTVGTAAAASEAGQQQHYVGCKSMCGCQNRARQLGNDTDGGCPGMAGRSAIENEPHPPGGYCGCAQGDCVAWLRGLFSRDAAGQRYCDAITDMAHGADGKRAVYCQAYDDNAGTRSYGNGVVKVTLCNAGFEFAQDRAGQC